MSVVVPGWSIKHVVILAVVHDTGFELYGMLVAGLSTAASDSARPSISKGVAQMSKTTITRLFGAAVAAIVAGTAVGIAGAATGLANGAVVLGGPQLVTLNADALAWAVGAGVIGSLLVAAGSVAAITAWVGALLNTSRLEDKTWFFVLLILGLISLGWVAVIAYLLAGPEGAARDAAPSAAS